MPPATPRVFSPRGIGSCRRTRFGRTRAASDTDVLGTTGLGNACVSPANGTARPSLMIDAGETQALPARTMGIDVRPWVGQRELALA